MQLDGLNYQEMSEVLGVSPENYIPVRLNRIRKQLADQFGKEQTMNFEGLQIRVQNMKTKIPFRVGRIRSGLPRAVSATIIPTHAADRDVHK
jgi:hypothetical protein